LADIVLRLDERVLKSTPFFFAEGEQVENHEATRESL
jgi:hypothetical protein